VQQRVDELLKEEIERLRFIAEQEAKATREVFQLQEAKVRSRSQHDVEAKLSVMNSSLSVPHHYDSLRHDHRYASHGISTRGRVANAGTSG
jgi:hypothetical protein